MTAPFSINFRKAYYIKLGEKGAWEAESIASGRMRIGWEHIPLEDMNTGQWTKIGQALRELWPTKKSVATRDTNRLRDIADSTDEDIWITFHASKLWWARLKNGPIKQDKKANYRETLDGWHDHSLTGRTLVMSELPGKLVTTQGFRGTVCKVAERDLLKRVIEGGRSPIADQLKAQHQALAAAVRTAIEQLHWKDYETLVDMVFRHAGWERVGVLGEQAKSYDLELREPVLRERYVVQVKSRASLADLEQTIVDFEQSPFRKVFFVVHTPAGDLLKAKERLPEHVVLVAPENLAELVVNAGLVNWLEEKVA